MGRHTAIIRCTPLAESLIPQLRAFLGDRLPEYMLPVDLYADRPHAAFDTQTARSTGVQLPAPSEFRREAPAELCGAANSRQRAAHHRYLAEHTGCGAAWHP